MLSGLLSKSQFAMSKREFKSCWEKATPGSQKEKNEAFEAFVNFWNRRTGTEFESIQELDENQLKTLVRDSIVDTLAAKGLQLKLTANKNFILCRVRAPIRLLEIQADIDNYPLQLRGEIDPGSEEFWNQTMNGRAPEIQEEQKLLSLSDAKVILEKLYRAGKISAADMIINTKDETKEAWSMRVHALERIADRVPIYNKFLPFGTVMLGKPHLRYLFQTYPSVRSMTLFKTKDRLLLTKNIIESCFDLEVLIDKKLVVDFTALHDANRGEALTFSVLARRWIYFWSASAREVGSPTVTHPTYEAGVELPFYQRPFAQPLMDIKDYFGEKVALYYAWLGHFTFMLIIPALFAAAVELFFYFRGEQIQYSGIDWATYGYGIAVLTWGTVYIQMWRQECRAIAVKWGTRGFENEEKPRPQFDGITKRSEVTNELEVYFPEEARYAKSTVSWALIILVTVLSMMMILAVYFFEFLASVQDSALLQSFWMTVIASIAVAVIIQINGVWYLQLAFGLNNFENYRTETDYEDHLVFKLIFFELLNTFGAAAFVAYGKGAVFGTCYGDCFVDLRTLLYAIILVRVLKSSFEMIVATVEKPLRDFVRFFYACTCGACIRWMQRCIYGRASFTFDQYDEEENAGLISEGNEEDKIFVKEIELKPFPSTFVESSGVFFQFAFINLFSLVIPVLAIVSLFENLIKIRVDAFKLCYRCRRPHADRAEDTGYWFETMEYMLYAGIYVNVAFALFAFPDLDGFSYLYRVVLFLCVTQVLVLYVMWLKWLLPEEPEYLKDVIKRQAFIITKYIAGFQDQNKVSEERSIFEETEEAIATVIDIDSLQLHDLRRGKKLEDKELEDMEKLELKRRELVQKIKASQDRLQELYKTESFNDVLGVGETKQGLSLGRLVVRIDSVINCHIPATHFKIRVRIVPDERNERTIKIPPILALPSSLTDTPWTLFTIEPSETVDELDADLMMGMDRNARHYVPFKTDDADSAADEEANPMSNSLSAPKFLAQTNKNKNFLKSFIMHIDEGEEVNKSNPYLPLSIGPFAPIKTIHANIIFELFFKIESSNSAQFPPYSMPFFQASLPLKKLVDQTPKNEVLIFKPISKTKLPLGNGKERIDVNVNLLFQYSKIVPIRNKVAQLQHQLQLIEEALTSVLGGKTPHTDTKVTV